MSREIVANLAFRNSSNKIDADAIARKIEQGYLAGRREDKHTKKVSFAPSAIGYGYGTCPRYWYQAFNGADYVEKTDAIGIANMNNGSAAHDRIQKAFELSGILVESEKEITLEDPPVRGYIDVLVQMDPDGEVLVGEIKTTRAEAFMFRQSTMKPSANHLYQILIYLKATGLKNGFLMYENKNDQTFLIIPVSWNKKNEAFLEECLEWLRMVRKNWADSLDEEGNPTDKNLPMRPWTRRNKNCRECALFELCWPEDKSLEKPGVVDIAPMVVPKL